MSLSFTMVGLEATVQNGTQHVDPSLPYGRSSERRHPVKAEVVMLQFDYLQLPLRESFPGTLLE